MKLHNCVSLITSIILLFVLNSCNGMILSFSGAGERPVPTPEDIEGFFVQGGKLYDANGYQFQMKGVNVNHWWNATATADGDTATIEAIPYIKASGANAVRVVFGPIEDDADSWHRIGMTTELRRAAVAEYVKYKIAPVVEYHNGTGNNDSKWIDEAADFWIGEKSWLDEFGRYVMINISNEWAQQWNGEDDVAGITYAEWAETYKSAITKMRTAGIKNLLVIDSFNYAGSAQCIFEYGQELIDHDPMHNVMFSIHAYGGWYSSATTDYEVKNIEDQYTRNWSADYALSLLEEKNITVMIGEFNKQHTLSVNGTCAEDTQLIEDFNLHKTGWIFWMWENSAADMVVGDTSSFSYSYYGQAIVPYMKDSKEATVFPDTAYPALPVPEPADPNWDPGPVTVNSRQSDYWLEAYIDHWTNDTPSYMEMEFEDDGTIFRMKYADWGNTFKTIEYNEPTDLGKSVRFWVYAANGSVAKTVFSELAYNKDFAIDPN